MAVMMRKRFIGGVAALAIAVTAIGTTTAQAQTRITPEGALAALLGLAIVGAIIHEKQEDERRDRRRAAAPKKNTATVINPRPLPRRAVRADILPGECIRRFDRTNGGQIRILGQRCMNRNYQFTQSLPQACKRVLQTSNGLRRGWSARCLRKQGYQVAHR